MARKFGFLFLGVCLVISALGFVGCKTGNEDTDLIEIDEAGLVEYWKAGAILVGTWGSEYGDSYTITASTISYDSGYGEDTNYAGTIRGVRTFTNDAGVIIIEYTKAPKYSTYDKEGNITATNNAPGNFIGVYYKDLKSDSVRMGQAYKALGAETKTLDEAKSTFTVGNEGTYMTNYGTYAEQ